MIESIFGLLVGGLLGALSMILVIAGKEADEDMPPIENKEETKEITEQ